ncbi:MAG: NADH-quinone oxidoreductase subunit K [Deltaproteobacteria bacterium]|jgi:multicomponent Na+:H+ antiporter subunit C|nr:NADH-quinone oxidoreductase subunit K [Deltaproteobacteria bacterium]
MIWAVLIATGTVVATGIYLALSRDLFRCLIGLALLGNGINLVLFSSGRLNTQVPPIIKQAEATLHNAANALPQALVLTAIVISFALLCFSLVLAVRIIQLSGNDDILAIRQAEPPATDSIKPALEEEP